MEFVKRMCIFITMIGKVLHILQISLNKYNIWFKLLSSKIRVTILDLLKVTKRMLITYLHSNLNFVLNNIIIAFRIIQTKNKIEFVKYNLNCLWKV